MRISRVPCGRWKLVRREKVDREYLIVLQACQRCDMYLIGVSDFWFMMRSGAEDNLEPGVLSCSEYNRLLWPLMTALWTPKNLIRQTLI